MGGRKIWAVGELRVVRIEGKERLESEIVEMMISWIETRKSFIRN